MSSMNVEPAIAFSPSSKADGGRKVAFFSTPKRTCDLLEPNIAAMIASFFQQGSQIWLREDLCTIEIGDNG